MKKRPSQTDEGMSVAGAAKGRATAEARAVALGRVARATSPVEFLGLEAWVEAEDVVECQGSRGLVFFFQEI
jgi:hypothetical protein